MGFVIMGQFVEGLARVARSYWFARRSRRLARCAFAQLFVRFAHGYWLTAFAVICSLTLTVIGSLAFAHEYITRE